jgi:hypothetical protein
MKNRTNSLSHFRIPARWFAAFIIEHSEQALDAISMFFTERLLTAALCLREHPLKMFAHHGWRLISI